VELVALLIVVDVVVERVTVAAAEGRLLVPGVQLVDVAGTVPVAAAERLKAMDAGVHLATRPPVE
jgi:hypothetical protein